MSKTYAHASRHLDAIEDHRHMLPNGEMTQGMLRKPTKDGFAMHTHLYEFEEDTLETGPMHDLAGHEHSTEMGETSGPQPMAKKPGEPWQPDEKLQRRGDSWYVVNGRGDVLSKGRTHMDALEDWADGAEGDQHDKAMMDAHVNEALWSKAKRASQEAFGTIKWPFVMWWYQNQGGE